MCRLNIFLPDIVRISHPQVSRTFQERIDTLLIQAFAQQQHMAGNSSQWSGVGPNFQQRGGSVIATRVTLCWNLFCSDDNHLNLNLFQFALEWSASYVALQQHCCKRRIAFYFVPVFVVQALKQILGFCESSNEEFLELA
jgi:hypothetical protein